jgi:hypothetical protein
LWSLVVVFGVGQHGQSVGKSGRDYLIEKGAEFLIGHHRSIWFGLTKEEFSSGEWPASVSIRASLENYRLSLLSRDDINVV